MAKSNVYEEVLTRLDWDAKTGLFYWNHPAKGRKPNACACSIIRPHKNSAYYSIRHFKKHILAHRLVWYMHHRSLPDNMQIDHINHNGLDNRLQNLRLVTPSENAKNLPRKTVNKSGHTGVWKHSQYNRWCAQIGNKKLGVFKTKKAAVLARKQAEKHHGYHFNHYKRPA